MATSTYMTGRRKYQRPQAILFSENSGTLVDGFFAPVGYEVGQDVPPEADASLIDQFIILSDDNRSALEFKPTRIEQRDRMINGRMRSYHIADKLTISASWNMLPSRAFSSIANFNSSGKSTMSSDFGKPGSSDNSYTSDGGAGGVELLDWYNNHKGSFFVYLSYDNYKNLGSDAESFNKLNKYSEVVEVFFADFSYAVNKRGGSNYDFWDISFTLEEV